MPSTNVPRRAFLAWSGAFSLGLVARATAVEPAAAGSPLEFLTAWGEMGTGPGQFHAPIGLAINDASEIYVSEFHNNRVQRFTSDGKFLHEFPTAPMPGGLAVDRAGTVYVAPMMSHKICVYSPAGKLLREW